MWSFVIICVLCFVIATDAVNVMVTTSEYKGEIKSCHQDNEVDIIAFEEKLLLLSVQSDDNDFIKCHKIDDLELMSNISHNEPLTITKDMGGKWQCATRSDTCFIKLHVRLKDSPQKVLQHNMVIETNITNITEEYDHFGQAFYTDGDDLNITCIVEDNTPITHNISLKYVCSGKKGVVQDQPILGNATKDCHLVCIYKYKNDYSETKVTFVPYPHDEIGYMKVNGHIARQNWVDEDGYGAKKFTPNYIFTNNDPVNVTCHTENEFYFVSLDCEKKTKNKPYECSICNKTNNGFEAYKFTANIRKLLPKVIEPVKTTVIVNTKPPKIVTPKPPESSNIGITVAIICCVIVLPFVIGIVIYNVYKMWKQKRATVNHNNQNDNEGILRAGDQQNDVYSEPYDHSRNYIQENISMNDIDTKANAHANSKNTNGSMPRTVNHSNSVYISEPHQENLYTKAIPKNLRPLNTNTTLPKVSKPTKFETAQHANENKVGAGSGEDLYVNTEEATNENEVGAGSGEDLYVNAEEATKEKEVRAGSGEDLYVNAKEAVLGKDLNVNKANLDKDIYNNVCQEPFYGNNVDVEPTYSKPS